MIPIPIVLKYGNEALIPSGEIVFTGSTNSIQTFDFVVPENVFSFSVVCVGAGGVVSSSPTTGGAGGGGLSYRNNILTTPGKTYKIRIGYPGSSIASQITYDENIIVIANAGGVPKTNEGAAGGTGGKAANPVNDGGGNGGNGGTSNITTYKLGGCGGAGGYSGDGGTGYQATGSDGHGGGGGSGSGGTRISYSGGGVGLHGQGFGGAAGVNAIGGNGSLNAESLYYGGAVGNEPNKNLKNSLGGCRIIWGKNRNFPNNNV